MIRFMLKNNDIEVFDFYDKHLISDSSKNDISKNDISKNDILLYESDSEYSEMYTSDEDFEYVDISNIKYEIDDKNVIINENNEINKNKEMTNNMGEIEINNETGILKKSFYNLGKILINYSPI